MRVLDLFSGIGGFSLGLERAGMETLFCVRNNKGEYWNNDLGWVENYEGGKGKISVFTEQQKNKLNLPIIGVDPNTVFWDEL